MLRMSLRAVLLVALALLVAGCALLGDAVTLRGTILGYYFGITDDVLVTFTRNGASFTVSVPVTSSYDQNGEFVVANVPAGAYAIGISFPCNNGAIDMTNGTTYSIDGGDPVPVDTEVVTGSSPPYVHTVGIDAVSLADGILIDIYFGNVE